MGFAYTLLFVVLLIIIFGVRIVQQYEQGVVFRFGRVTGRVKQPGLCLIIPVIDVMHKVSMRTITMPIPSQKVISKDNVSIDVAAVAYYRVVNPVKSLVEIENVAAAINQRAQSTVRNVSGQHVLDDILSATDKINQMVKEVLENTVSQWGVELSRVELKDMQLPDSMQRAMAAQAEAERDKRAKIIAAEGEYMSAEKLGQAADIIQNHPIALQLRNLQVLAQIASEQNSTIVFPAQLMDTMSSVREFMAREHK